MSESRKCAAPLKPSKNRLLKLAQKRLEKYVSIAPKLLVNDHPDNIHDMRVWSRRLQQIISVLFPKPRSSKSQKVIRFLRNIRRDLSTCRNLDVDLKLLQEKLDSANGPRLTAHGTISGNIR